MEENLNHEQSLLLINEMIKRAQNNVKMEGTFSLIYWGYVTATLAIIHSVLFHTLNDHSMGSWIWTLMLPAGIVLYFIGRREDKTRLVKTHIDKIGGMVWAGFLISFVVFMVVIHTLNLIFNVPGIFMLQTPTLMIMVGMGQFISACIYSHKMWYVIAALTWTGAVVCAFVYVEIQMIVFAMCMILGFTVPGHILNYQAKKKHV